MRKPSTQPTLYHVIHQVELVGLSKTGNLLEFGLRARKNFRQTRLARFLRRHTQAIEIGAGSFLIAFSVSLAINLIIARILS